MFSNFLGIFKQKSLPRNEFRYLRERNGICFTFVSTIEIIVSDDFSSVIDAIINGSSNGICGDQVAEHVYKLLVKSNNAISAIYIRKPDRNGNYTIEIIS